MPYKRKYRKRRRRRRTGFSKNLLGQSLATTLRYNQQFDLDAGMNPAVAVQVMFANSLFDPDVTGVGHQPRGFDEIMPLYDYYVVVGAKITVKTSPTATSSHLWGIRLKDSSSLETTLTNYLEARNVVSKMIGVSAGPQQVLTYGFSAKKFLGRSHPMSDSQLKGSASTSPTEGAFFHLFTGSPIAGANPVAQAFDVTIEYRVVFIEPKNPTIS